MPSTNFGALLDQQKLVWSRDFWSQARTLSYASRFFGTGQNAMIQRITELTKSERGVRAIITLIPDSPGGEVVGDRRLQGNETPLAAYDREITLDFLRKAHKNTGRLADQATVVNFRKAAKDALSYWASDVIDQLVWQTLGGIDYSLFPNGSPRPLGSQLQLLSFNADVRAPTDKRRYVWKRNTTGDVNDGELVQGGATTDVAATDKISWNLLVKLKTQAVLNHIKPRRGEGGSSVFDVFLDPITNQNLKLDDRYLTILKDAAAQGAKNPLFTGDGVIVDGLHIHSHEYIPNTIGAASGAKYGATGTVNGGQVLLCGAQALAYADIGGGYWEEEPDDYKNSYGISAGRMIGFLKPSFPTIYSGGTDEDHGVIVTYVAH